MSLPRALFGLTTGKHGAAKTIVARYKLLIVEKAILAKYKVLPCFLFLAVQRFRAKFGSGYGSRLIY